ncbi:hypothetical protein EDM59_01830 [Brevibacillus nitrificans]|uniref:Uncharacterized protein n=2 Tax=Brevibacillus nitrificans TaxID=651560 RepID=A0A3M8DRU5_9BACL|nr:hypothetical protein EDM59_01830 [Brevibacillus nitrificans]
MEHMGMFRRKKRNLNLTDKNNGNHADHGIDWDKGKQSQHGGEDQFPLYWGESEIDEEEEMEDEHNQTFESSGQSEKREMSFEMLSGFTKRPDFEANNQKLTIYVEKALMEEIGKLKKERYIKSYSSLVNEAVKQYLTTKR